MPVKKIKNKNVFLVWTLKCAQLWSGRLVSLSCIWFIKENEHTDLPHITDGQEGTVHVFFFLFLSFSNFCTEYICTSFCQWHIITFKVVHCGLKLPEHTANYAPTLSLSHSFRFSFTTCVISAAVLLELHHSYWGGCKSCSVIDFRVVSHTHLLSVLPSAAAAEEASAWMGLCLSSMVINYTKHPLTFTHTDIQCSK